VVIILLFAGIVLFFESMKIAVPAFYVILTDMIRDLFYIFVVYLLYKFIFDFIVPLFRATNKIQRDFRTMQQKMQDQMNAQQNASAPQQPQASSSKAPGHDYIDFEEVKK
jgi:hypothetical protein